MHRDPTALHLNIGPPSDGPAAVGASGELALIALVIIAAAVFQLAAAVDVGLWYQPDSVGYLTLSEWLTKHGNFEHPWFVARTPGYPLLLGAVSLARGFGSGWAILGLQHAMVVGCSLAGFGLARRLTGSRIAACVAGLLCGCSWSLTGYAGVVLTETPCTLTLLCAVYALIRFLDGGGTRWMLAGSTLLGCAALIRPAVLPVSLALPLAMRLARHAGRTPPDMMPARPQRGAAMAMAGFGPFLLLFGGWSIITRVEHGAAGAGNFAGRTLYHRVVTRGGWTDPDSPALEDIRRCVARVNAEDSSAPPFDARMEEHAVLCLQRVHGWNLAQASGRLGEAAWPIFVEHASEVFAQTPRQAAYLLLIPDAIHRYRPSGEAARLNAEDGSGVWRSTEAFADDVRRRFAQVGGQWPLPAPRSPSAWSAWRSACVRAFDRVVLRSEGVPFMPGDTPFEQWTFLCVIGTLGGMAGRRGKLWTFVGVVATLVILPCAILPGFDSRLGVPVRPLIHMGGAALSGWAVAGLARGLRRVRSLEPLAPAMTP